VLFEPLVSAGSLQNRRPNEVAPADREDRRDAASSSICTNLAGCFELENCEKKKKKKKKKRRITPVSHCAQRTQII